jgi:hypothetical protein
MINIANKSLNFTDLKTNFLDVANTMLDTLQQHSEVFIWVGLEERLGLPAVIILYLIRIISSYIS